MRRSLLCTLLVALAFLPGCIVPGRGSQIDAKGFGGEEEARKAVKGALAWVSHALATAGTRNFDFAAEALDYGGADATLRASVQALRGNADEFAGAQSLLKQIMQGPVLARITARLTADVAHDDAMAAFGASTTQSVARDGKLWFRLSAVEDRMNDPRRLVIFVVEELLRDFAFGADSAAVGFAPGYGETAAPALDVPATLAGTTNGRVRALVALEMVLLSDDYRFGLVGDDPDPSGVTWGSVANDGFGGPGGETIAAADVSGAKWDFGADSTIATTTARQENGYLLADWYSPFVFAKRRLRDVRLTASSLFPATVWGWERIDLYYRRPQRPTQEITGDPGRFMVWRRPGTFGLAVHGTASDGSSTCAVDWTNGADLGTEILADVSLTVSGSSVVLRINGGTVCYFEDTVDDVGEAGILGRGIRIDRLRIDEGR